MSTKIYTIVSKKNSREIEFTGTLEELIPKFAYTLECGKSYESEKGNKKISLQPKTVKSLVSNLNNAVNNSAANGYSSTSYYLV